MVQHLAAETVEKYHNAEVPTEAGGIHDDAVGKWPMVWRS